MPDEPASAFPSEVVHHLKWYVYRLIDPRNGETFYVGKGKGNRVFAHARADADIDRDEGDTKTARIREIRLAGFDVAHVIHRHGLETENVAFEVEAALIDAYPGLTNVLGGHGSAEFGVMHAEEVIRQYKAEPAIFCHKALLINVSRSVTRRDLYDATRFAWRLSPDRAAEAEVVLPVQQGVIVGAFVADRWLPAASDNFPGRGHEPERWGFVGEEAPPEIAKHYVMKRVPEELRKRGASNPIRYTW